MNLKKASDLYLTIAFIGMILIGAIIIVFRESIVDVYDIKRHYQLISSAILLLFVFFSNRVKKDIVYLAFSFPFNIKIAVFVFICAILFSDFAINYDLVNSSFTFYFLSIFILVMATALYIDRKLTYVLFILLIISFYFYILIGHTYVTIILEEVPDYYSIFGYLNPRVMNQMQAWIFIPCLHFLYLCHKKKSNISFALLFSVNITIIYALDARGLAISSLVGVFMWLFIVGFNRSTVLFLLVSVLFGTMLKVVTLAPMPQIFFIGYEFLFEDIIDVRDDHMNRIKIWKDTFSILSLLGEGSASYTCNQSDHTIPHNSVLYIAYQWGVLPALCFIYLCLTSFKKIIFGKSIKHRIVNLSVLVPLAYSLVSGVLIYPLSVFIGAISIGLLINETVRIKKVDCSVWIYKSIIGLMAFCCIVSLLYLSIDRVINNEVSISRDDKISLEMWANPPKEHCNLDMI
ncbi:hypothetical protein A6E01_02880 [Vibrio breoganii]|uniref:O-antigen ligase domain-containing protein n=1 Tax=Vibrio breoganii TaxID=553239 RepID=A0AAN0XTA5_9VIBR|nr:hypothetical protein [Vibrio breoganii]ANO32217.1 hypothetical protein A6E01_02880 [Vibrio breoganii]